MTTMDDKYKDGSTCTVCDVCGYCIDHGDCKELGCGQRLVNLPPHIEPEHKKILDAAEQHLAEYSEALANRLIPRECLGASIESSWRAGERERGFRLFSEDPVRKHLVSEIVKIKALYEKPRYLLRTQAAKQVEGQ